jgi:FtsP/CotA-like multicopper oxidase with cupredoxin domain
MRKISKICSVALFGAALVFAQSAGSASTALVGPPPGAQAGSNDMPSPQQRLEMMRHMPQMRADAADKAATKGLRVATKTKSVRIKGAPGQTAADNTAAATGFAAAAAPLATPDYFGSVPNYANSPLPVVDPTTGVVSGGMRKFVDTLPGLGASNANDLGQYIPPADSAANQIAADGYDPASWKAPAADYYWIGLVQYSKQMHKDLPATTLRGYVQLTTSPTSYPIEAPNQTTMNGQQLYSVAPPQYLGPMIVAQKDTPVRVKFSNLLPTGTGGNLFLPVDTSVMGAGAGNQGDYTQNRGTLHLHGGNTPWISDGTQHQWVTPSGETTPYPKGVSARNVPDMGTSCDAANSGCETFYYTNQQSARLLFYHDHSYGITRLNVYAGEAAGYLVQDPVEQGLVSKGTLPADQIPLVLQDKTFVPDAAQLAAEDPTWDSASWGGKGNLWFPHVYMPNQNPDSTAGANPMGRWDYGPWFWPPFTGLQHGPVANPLYDPTNAPWEGSQNPGTPNPTIVPEAFMDTPVINGTAYPALSVDPKAYRFRILNAANDRYWNLSLWKEAAATSPTFTAGGALADSNWDASGRLVDPGIGEVKTVPFNSTQNGQPSCVPGQGTYFPSSWYDASVPNPFDDRVGGVPDPCTAGPQMVQIGTEGGFLPATASIKNQPITYVMNKRDITVGNVAQKALFLGPAERADVVVDFSQFAGQDLVLYNDSPAPVPAGDPRNDYFTGNPDLTATGGAPTTLPGYGPNTRTMMLIHVAGTSPAPAFDKAALDAALPTAYAASGQDKPLVPESAYGPAFGATFPDKSVRIQDTSVSYDNGLYGLTGLKLTSGGSGYSTAPNVTFSGGGGTGAAATATLGPGSVGAINVNNSGSGYTKPPPNVNISGGGGTGATASAVLAPTGSVKAATVTSGGSGYTSAPTVVFTGGGGSGATATATVSNRRVTGVTITSGGSGYTSAPSVSFTGGGGSGATATATLGFAISGVTVTTGGSGYTSAPTVSFSGGGGSGATATAVLSRPVASLTLTSAGKDYTAAPTVSIEPPTAQGTTASATASIAVQLDLKPKSIIENFDPDYGRMNALLGVEMPNTTGMNQTSIPYRDVDPPTEVIKSTRNPDLTPIGTLNDGTQIWKITHNGVDTHAMHWHMFDVQVINRVGWDGAIRPADANELGWKDTVRMNPLEDIIVALRPEIPTLPWDLPNSIRQLDVTAADGSTGQFSGLDPTGTPARVVNHAINFGWEYVWHCHLLGHEENIMMRSIAVAVQPTSASGLTATALTTGVSLSWSDKSANETAFVVQRATAAAPTTWTNLATLQSATGPAIGGTINYTDTSTTKKTSYLYRVVARNVVGDTTTYAAPAVGYPRVSVDADPTGSVSVTSR